MRTLVFTALMLLIMLGVCGCGDSGSSYSPAPPAPQQKAWYSGGTLHAAKMSEYSRASYANRLATSADFVTTMMQMDGKTIPPVDQIRPLAEKLEHNISAANKDGIQTVKMSPQ